MRDERLILMCIKFSSVKEILPGKYDIISYNKYVVKKTTNGVSIMEFDIVEVFAR